MKHARKLVLFLSVALLLCASLLQRPVSAQVFPRQVIYAASYGMKCDGSTDDTAALRSAIAAGGLQAQIILPPGTCLISIESGDILLYDGSWISGAGRFATTIKRKNGGTANNSIFGIASGGAFGTVGNVTFSDFTIDGNQSAQTSGADNIQGLANTSKFTVQRMRFINARRSVIHLNASSGFNSDSLIAESDFENNGFSSAIPCNSGDACGDIDIINPLRERILGNRSDSAQTFLVHSSATGSGNVMVSHNIVNSCLGFGVALGGGTATLPEPAAISDNIFNCPASIQNIIDVAAWSDIRVANNTITVGTLAGGAGIGDAPPANKVIVTGNRIFGNPAASNYCISLGGSNLTIMTNTCDNAGGVGILIAASSTTGLQQSIVITGNIVKNASRANTGVHAGIEFFLQPGGNAALSGVIVRGNKLYDDQGSPTQGWGIGLAIAGQTTGFSNFIIEGNDVRGNKIAGINANNLLTPPSGFLVLDNPGDVNAGVCAVPSSPANCVMAQSGSVAITHPATTIVVHTAAVTAGSKILVTEDSSLGTLLGVTCNATPGRTYMVTARTAGNNFTIVAAPAPTTNSACLSFTIIPAD